MALSVVAVLVFLGVVVPLIASGRIPQRVFNDQVLYHEATVRAFLKQWPHFNFCDYYTATTPLYHVLIAAGCKVLGDATWIMQALSAVVGALLIFPLTFWAVRRAGAVGLAFVLPLCTSMYVVQAGAYVLPDNLGWACVCAIFLVAFSRQPTWIWLGVMSLLVTTTIWSRQNHIWTAGLICVWAWLPRRTEHDAGLQSVMCDRFAGRTGRAVVMGVLTVPALLSLAYFYSMWGGLVPARFAGFHQGLNLATPAIVLGVIGLFSVFFMVTLAPVLRDAWRDRRSVLFMSAGLGAIIAVIPKTTYDMDHGRWTGLFDIAKRMPVVMGHSSPVIVLCAAWGGVSLAGWLWLCSWRQRLVVLTALAAFTCAQSANMQLWQRYVEPFVLIVLAVLAVHVAMRRLGTVRNNLQLIGPSVLAVLFVLMTVLSMRNAPVLQPVTDPTIEPMGGWQLRYCP